MRARTFLLKNSTCLQLSGFSRETFTRRRMAWAEKRVPGRIRFKWLALDTDAEELPRFYLPDVEAFMMSPRMCSALEFVPVFTVPAAAQRIRSIPQPKVNLWSCRLVGASSRAQFLDVRRDTIEFRMIDWEDEPVPYRIRCGKTELKIGRNFVRVCYRPDVEALLKNPELVDVSASANSFQEGRTNKGE